MKKEQLGGGFWYDGLSDIALSFMIDWISTKHRKVNFQAVSDIDFSSLIASDGSYAIDDEDIAILPNHKGKTHSQDRWWPIEKATLSTRSVRVETGDGALPLLHNSVIHRFKDIDGYRPKALKGLSHKVYGVTGEFKGLNSHRKATG